MATLYIRDETYRQLASKAALGHTTVEALIEPELERLARGAVPVEAAPLMQSKRQAFEQWQQVVQGRAGRYPNGRAVDDDRESIYGGAEERGV